MRTNHCVASLLSFALLLPCMADAGVSAATFTIVKQCQDAQGGNIACSGSFDFVVTDPYQQMTVTLADGNQWQADVPIDGNSMASLDSMSSDTLGIYTVQEADPGSLWELVDIKFFSPGLTDASLASCFVDCGIPIIDIKNRMVTFSPFGGETLIFSNRQVPQVPIPAALWLFGSGMLGLAGMARRSRAA